MEIGNAQFRERKGAAPAQPRPFQWEYRTAIMDREADLSQFGAEGWELVSVTPDAGDRATYYFKKRRA